jgi:hypothetical protein
MSLEHSPARPRRQHPDTKHPQRASTLSAPLSMTSLHDDQVLTFREWCQLNRISERTGRRILQGGNGPVVTKLSSKRLGVIVRNNKAFNSLGRGGEFPERRGA